MPGIASGSGNIMANKIDKVPTLMELTFPAREAGSKSTNRYVLTGSAKCHKEK